MLIPQNCYCIKETEWFWFSEERRGKVPYGNDIVDSEQLKSQKRELKDYMDSKSHSELASLKKDISGNSKKLREDKSYVWKIIDNKDKFSNNSNVSDKITQALWGLRTDKYEYSEDILKEYLERIAKRSKLINIADSSEGGWETVKVYESNPLAGDSDDDKT
ncbi:hypothetical protein LOTGIDRAFT_161990 [Lottia gigantea]|uniref:Uncharacterized protein n=1 Tax=Lottia gigantea TaxID=225164 RepID=V3ZNL9_LOTGI|nr:hypothetical protein LOTGIDRAFT_161990 [Lottia gigantea]ESO92963.1 hypothetical protein LOTGIDRAFT_161990 [Lottia gigantea]